ncbi:hypothetical protein M8542_47165 [Amycolatopsis sp. OK19-0408]|uniref:VWFA domain-containing protein n=1 Tax=Amycolatopsis iheyensis TaxID=2945988 RepID=A0A9X2NKC9_9PSEU|nr:hypothetical protein [Amycolatopsis iheyensis]MCR6490411.1 hypothetical protein [Amycolatopsis iheyensis]
MPDRVLPCYVVFDESCSMADHMDSLNTGLRELTGTLLGEPSIAGRTRLCVIGFAETARIVTPLSTPGTGPARDGRAIGTETNFGAAFAVLRETIERDVEALRSASCAVHQPVVFFLSDGQPTDPAAWPSAHAGLVDPGWAARPRIVAFGIGDADMTTIARVGTHGAYLSTGDLTPRDTVREFTAALAGSVVASGAAELTVPRQVSGFTALETDAV